MLFLGLRPVPPAATPHGSVAVWVLIAVVLAIVCAAGLVLASRR